MNVRDMLKEDEGLRLKVYKDTQGHDTIGYGFCLNDFDVSDAEYFLTKKMGQCIDFLNNTYAWYHRLDDVRKAAIVNMVYNLGQTGFADFRHTIYFLERKEYDLAATQIKASLAYKQLPHRYDRICYMIKTGEWPVK